jgi:phosphohistidine swiveling domain-containing protein
MEWTCCLQVVEQNEIAMVGGKAVNLGILTRAGLPVPPGFVIHTSAYARFLIAYEIQATIEELSDCIDPLEPDSMEQASRAIRALIEQGTMPDELASAIIEAYAGIGEGAVAVRSSATAEDLPGASFAGQQESYLNIEGAEEILRAVKHCWSSLWTARAIAYRAQQGIKADGTSMAVVVQRMIAADVAGILFTVNAVTGVGDEMVMEASWGLGETIVGGRVNPDTIVVDKATGAIRHVRLGEKAVMTVPVAGGTDEVEVDSGKRACAVLSSEQIGEIVRTGCEIESLFGMPQDIEWAFAGQKLYILQARPITALASSITKKDEQKEVARVPVAPGDDAWDRGNDKPPQPFDLWTRTNFGENLPFPVTPLTSTGFPLIMGQNIDPGQAGPQVARRFYGRLYINEGAIMHMLSEDYGLPTFVIDSMWGSNRRGKHKSKGKFRPWRLIRRIPSLLRMLSQQRKKGKARSGKQTAEQFFAQIDSWVNDFMQRDLQSFVDRVLWAEGIPAWSERGAYVMGKNIAVSTPSAVMFGLLERLVGWWARRKEITHDLVTGISGVYSAEVGPMLWRMALSLREAGLADVVLDKSPEEALAQLKQTPEAGPFMEQFETFLQRHGHRCPNEVELLHPRWAEAPQQVIELLAGYLQAGDTLNPEKAEGRQRQRRDEAVELVEKRLGPVRRKIFRGVLAKAQNAVRVRDNSRYAVTKFLFPTRKVFALLGQRWAERGWLSQPDDIFFLTVSELEKLVADEDPQALEYDLRALVANRRLAYEYWFTVVPPDVIGPDGEPVVEEEKETTVLEGVAVSGGRARGVARIVLDPREAARLHAGEILVTQATDPGWTPVFPLVSGLVLEIGGQLSHGAIVAREYGIPAVLNVQGAMRRIRDGQVIIVDGNTGKVFMDG